MNEFFFRFAHITWLYLLLPLLVGITIIRLKVIKPVRYRYTLGTMLHAHQMTSRGYHKLVLFVLRFILLLILVLLIAKPQWVDSRSKVQAEGIDIVLALDVSGSMNNDDLDTTRRSRIDVAKTEAVHFIEKRKNDAIGLVIFAQDAISRAPITADKKLLIDIVNELYVGVINHEGTKLATALVTAVNRLKHSPAKSKIIILLTDGEPSPDDLDSKVAIEVAQKFGIKIYTVGIGGQEEVIVRNIFGMPIGKVGVNKQLLQTIAQQTGGQFFMAANADDMRRIYDTIDQLETTQLDIPIFTKYYDIFMPFVFLVLSLVLLELFLSAFIWFSV